MISISKKLLAHQLFSYFNQEVSGASSIKVSENDLLQLLEIPKIYEHGHLALPLFSLAKKLQKNPIQWAQDLAGVMTKMSLDFVERVQPVGGFVNFHLNSKHLTKTLFNSLQGEDYWRSESGRGQTLVIDYSSPNVAKRMHIGHMRATIVGQAIRNLADSQGFKVIGVNHLGDWGTQFGKLVWGYLNWKSEYDFSQKPIEALLAIYVRFHEEAEKNPKLEEEGAALFKRLEDGDPEIKRIWQLIIDYSMEDFNRLYKLMHIHHDMVLGESFYNDKMDDVVRRLEEKGLLKESEGAQVVFFDEKDKMPPCIIKKSDGASIYATRDLAAAIYRREVQRADKLVYVVGVEQALHFKQVFSVLRLLGYAWADQCVHVQFGRYRFKEGKMSTRSGKIVFMEDVLDEAFALVRKMVDEKNPNVENKDAMIKQVAMGAVFFNDLMNDRIKDVEFDWDRLTSTEGDSGPYVQYTAVRCRSLSRKYGRPVDMSRVTFSQVEEQKLIFSLLRFSEVLENSFKQLKPNILAQYLLELCSDFSQFYHKCRILGEAPEVEHSRMALVSAAEKVLVKGLKVLNIESPEAM